MTLAQQNADDWDDHVRHLIRYWKSNDQLSTNPLVDLLIVQRHMRSRALEGNPHRRAEALRYVVRQAIDTLAPDQESHPDTSDVYDSRWSMPEWRLYALLSLRLAGYTYDAVADYTSLAGGNYGKEYKRARSMLATIIRDTEGSPVELTDTRIIEYPSGALKPQDQFYIERDVDRLIAPAVATPGQTITIRGPRQVGKTSLLVRACRMAKERMGARVVNFDLQESGEEARSSLEAVLKSLSVQVYETLDLDFDYLEKVWSRSALLTPQLKAKNAMEYALRQTEAPIVLAMDEVDVIQTTTFSNDFFAMMRGWHNFRAQNDLWSKLTLILVVSTEPYLLIDRVGESPFNIGTKANIQDFTDDQAAELNRRYNSPVNPSDFRRLHGLLNGHPYLTRVALYTLMIQKTSWAELESKATDDEGPFGQHLKWQYRLIGQDSRLRKTMREVIQTGAVSVSTATWNSSISAR